MNKNAGYVRNRLSLRKPQEESLEILVQIADSLELTKTNPMNADELASFLEQELSKVKTLFPTCIDFERNFPSVCFSLATGVGKTRLMGSFIAYLYLEKGMHNFFILAPNLTVYNKLIADFSDTTSPKYVFQGMSEFVHNTPRIITGDNYEQISQSKLFESDLHINLFNISKINSETRGGNLPRIKRLTEYLGESYFNYLANLPDLVLLMDESHHYRADRGMAVLEELNPVIGLEVTATPQIERGGNAIKFKNVVYEYSLAKAIQDGFVKEPAVATRKDFNPSQYQPEELDRIKLEDGLRIHEDTKAALDIYSRDSKTELVKPFVLVVAKDTNHAGQLKRMISDPNFFNGDYADKVMEIHSNQSGEEKEDNINKLLSLEKHDNIIEIVIHVNMLKEGWDVTNLYTLIPLRTAASQTLREQTIGRGLRLPFGRRTGVDKVDKLTIVAHDRFQEIVDAANMPNSIIKLQNIITIDDLDIGRPKEVITAPTVIEQRLNEEQKRVDQITEPEKKQEEQINLIARQLVHSVLPEMNKQAKGIYELRTEEIQRMAVDRVREKLLTDPQQNLFVNEIMQKVEENYQQAVTEYSENVIAIPRITIQPKGEIKSGFHDFDLDVANLNLRPSDEHIIIKYLREGTIEIVDANQQRVLYGSIQNIIVSELMNYPEIDYDTQSDLLFKLTGQALDKFRSYLSEENDVIRVTKQNKYVIADFIYNQMMQKFFYHAVEFEEPIINVRAFTRIEKPNYTKYTTDSIVLFTETVTPTSSLPTKIFTGFKKACHTEYKFDSKTEKDFAIILEQDADVLKWLRPAQSQFKIYWRHNSRQYHPDFIVETADTIYMIETKRQDNLDSDEVDEKAKAAMEYCKYATRYSSQNEGKGWKYLLIPHTVVLASASFKFLAQSFEYRQTLSVH
ncbi:MAG: hypothetical protein AUJ54_12655 [Ignavibacteria bacterium CG1_02_37_35]|nr:MAG: hypothetical protein AUJ54_12655 [Ignavibacteria bacterium CG1_02_37_35]